MPKNFKSIYIILKNDNAVKKFLGNDLMISKNIWEFIQKISWKLPLIIKIIFLQDIFFTIKLKLFKLFL